MANLVCMVTLEEEEEEEEAKAGSIAGIDSASDMYVSFARVIPWLGGGGCGGFSGGGGWDAAAIPYNGKHLTLNGGLEGK